MKKTEWEKITEEAFSSDEVHEFSESYCRRRAELQGGTFMKKRERTNTRRFNMRAASIAAAFVLIPVGTVGAIHFASGGNGGTSQPAAEVEEAAGTSDAVEATVSGDLITINEDTGEEVAAKTRYMAVPDPLPEGWVATDGIFVRKYSYIDQAEDEGSTIARENSENSSYVSYYMFSGEVYDDIYKELSGKSEVVGWPEPESPRLEKSVTEFKHERDDGYDRDILIKFKDSDDFVALAVYYDVKQEDLYDLVQSFKLVKVDETTIPQASDENKAINEDNGEEVPVAEEAVAQVDDIEVPIDVKFNYMPEGLVEEGDVTYGCIRCFKYKDYDNGISATLYGSAGKDINDLAKESRLDDEQYDSFPSKTFDVDTGDETRNVYYRHISNEDSGVYAVIVKFNNSDFAADLTVMDEIPEEELVKFIKGMEIRFNQALTSEGK